MSNINIRLKNKDNTSTLYPQTTIQQVKGLKNQLDNKQEKVEKITPTSATTGFIGQILFDDSYLYICVDIDVSTSKYIWKKIQLVDL